MAARISHHSAPITFPAVRHGSLLRLLSQAFAAWRERRQLARLDATMRADIGLSLRQTMQESTRPIWDVPQSWRH